MATSRSRDVPSGTVGGLIAWAKTEILGTKRKDIARLIISEAGRFPDLAAFYHREVVARGMGMVRAIVERGVKSGEFTSDAAARFPHLARHGIGVSLVCPGAVHTPLTGTVQIAGVDTTSRRFRKVQARFHERAVSPETAAEAILKGVRRNRYWVYTSPDIRLIHAVQRYCPPAYSLTMRALNRGANRVLPEVGRARRIAQ